MSPSHLFMDRNLGSNGNHTTLTPEGVGMYYQWGRKEPFPGPSIFVDGDWEFDLTIDNNQRRVVNASNQQVLTKFENVNTLQNLGNSIHNPTVFYKADEWEVSVMQDWYTNSDSEMKYQNNYLWDDKKHRKTPYDPCPEGWRVPESSNVMLLNDLLKNGTVTPSSDGNVKWSYTHQQGQVWDITFHGYIEDGILKYATYFGDLWGRMWTNLPLWRHLSLLIHLKDIKTRTSGKSDPLSAASKTPTSGNHQPHNRAPNSTYGFIDFID